MTEESASKSPDLKGSIGLGTLIAIGVGGTIGASIFTIIGFAAQMAGPALIISFLIGGVLTILVGLNYSELSSTFPESGGGYTFAKKAYGGLSAFLTGWLMAFANLVFGALSALGFAFILGSALSIPSIAYIPIALFIMVTFGYLNTRGLEESGKTQVLLVIILILGLSAFVGFSIFFISPANLFPFMPFGWGGVLQATAFVYVAYFGFEAIATVSGEVKNPGKNLSIAIIVSIIICTVIYTTVSLMAVGVVGWAVLGESTSPLTTVAEATVGVSGMVLISVVGIISTLSSLNTAFVAATRVLFALSKDGLLPKAISNTGKRSTTTTATLIAAVVMGIFILVGSVDFIAHVADFGLLLALILITSSVFVLRRKRSVLDRPFKSSSILSLVCAAILALLIPFLSGIAIAVGVMVCISGVLLYLLRIAPRRNHSIAIGGFSAAGGGALLAVLGIGKWNIVLLMGYVPLELSGFLGVGVIVLILASIISVIPLGSFLDVDGYFESYSPVRVMLRNALEGVVSILVGGFAVMAALTFFAVIHGLVFFPWLTESWEGFRFLLSLTLAWFSVAAATTGLFLMRRKYVVAVYEESDNGLKKGAQ
ncbi:MAG: APC family permease [Candidatus Thorarchaeota archaeon]